MTTPTQQQIMDDAVLSAAVYDDVRNQYNKINPLPVGWSVPIGTNGSPLLITNAQGLGFAATAYQNGNNIVISYEGTDLNNIPNIIADGATDLFTGLGFGSPQIIQAALFYEQVKDAVIRAV